MHYCSIATISSCHGCSFLVLESCLENLVIVSILKVLKYEWLYHLHDALLAHLWHQFVQLAQCMLTIVGPPLGWWSPTNYSSLPSTAPSISSPPHNLSCRNLALPPSPLGLPSFGLGLSFSGLGLGQVAILGHLAGLVMEEVLVIGGMVLVGLTFVGLVLICLVLVDLVFLGWHLCVSYWLVYD